MKKSTPITILAAVLSFCATYSISYIIKLQTDPLAVSNSFLSLILMVTCFLTIKYGFTNIDKRSFCFSGLYGLMFSAMLVIGTEIYTQEALNYSLAKLAHKGFLIISFGVFLTACILCFLRWLPSWILKKEWRRPHYLLIWAIIFLCWIPAFLALYPGCIAYDMPNQVGQWVFKEYTTHHPLWHTLYISFFVWFGEHIGNINLGYALHILTQMILFSAMLSYVVWKLSDFKIPFAIQAGTLLFFALFPINTIFAVSATKDVLFSGFLLLLVIFVLDMLRDFDKFSHSVFYILRFILTVILLCNFRNNGLYAFLVMIPFVLFLKKKQRWFLFLLCICSCILAIGSSKITATIMHASKGSVAEMLSIPIQQFARIYTLQEDDLPAEMQEEMTYFIDKEKLPLYNPYLADPVKDGFRADYFKEHTLSFIKLWGKLSLRYPQEAIDAFLITSLGNWYPDMNYPNMHSYMETEIKDNYISIVLPDRNVQPYRDSKLPWLESYYNQFATKMPEQIPVQKLPGISMLFSPGFYSWCMLFTIGFLLYRRRYPQILALMPLLGLWLTLLLSPISLMRYSYPLMLCAPVYISLIYNAKQE